MRSARRAREGGFAISGVRAGERERLGKTDVWGTAAGRGAASENKVLEDGSSSGSGITRRAQGWRATADAWLGRQRT